ncbi:hypothetical protein P7K49_001814 [Saguinus oedipus]|uniref:Uncharacterized protein n=1 Tax=Saguinus oedipus TaxID=9490 RepID=A0ABQ9WI44_SAGOE|nr:hypothetical protein P7K49_001814 [Saguinus oedipus]
MGKWKRSQKLGSTVTGELAVSSFQRQYSEMLYQAYADYIGFILTLNEGVKGKKLTFEYKVSERGSSHSSLSSSPSLPAYHTIEAAPTFKKPSPEEELGAFELFIGPAELAAGPWLL